MFDIFINTNFSFLQWRKVSLLHLSHMNKLHNWKHKVLGLAFFFQKQNKETQKVKQLQLRLPLLSFNKKKKRFVWTHFFFIKKRMHINYRCWLCSHPFYEVFPYTHIWFPHIIPCWSENRSHGTGVFLNKLSTESVFHLGRKKFIREKKHPSVLVESNTRHYPS